MSLIADNILSPWAFVGYGLLLFTFGLRRWSTRGRFAGAVLMVLGLTAASVPSVVGIPVALTNAALLKMPASSLLPMPVARMGVNAIADAPISWWWQQSGACSVADVGSCNNAVDGNSFVAVAPSSGIDLRQFGVKFDNSTDNHTTMTAALTWAVANCTTVRAPAGTAYVATAISISNTTSGCAFSILGSGNASTMFRAASGQNLINLTENSPTQAFHVRDMSVLTSSAAGGGIGFNLHQTASIPDPAATESSDFTNVTARGADGFKVSDCWSSAIKNDYISNITFNNVNIYGCSTPAGIGVQFAGGSSSSTTAAVFNFFGGGAQGVVKGIDYGTYTQGMTLSSWNCVTASTACIYIESGTFQQQLAIVNSQFNCNASGCAGIYDNVGLLNLQVTNSMFLDITGTTGMNLNKFALFTIDGNIFSNAGGNGIVVTTPAAFIYSSRIVNNHFDSQLTPITLGASTSKILVRNNGFSQTSGGNGDVSSASSNNMIFADAPTGTGSTYGNAFSSVNVSGAVNSGGNIEVTVTTAGITNSQIVQACGIANVYVGCGLSPVTIVDSTHLILLALPFTGSYVSGGIVQLVP